MNTPLFVLVMFPIMLGIAIHNTVDRKETPIIYRLAPLAGWVLTAVLVIIFWKQL